MHRIGEEIHIDEDDVRGGSTPRIVRYVLGASLGLAVIAMSLVWISRAIYEQPGSGQPVTAEQHALG